MDLANADAYDERYKKWNIDDLPIIPQEWQFIVSAGKNEQFKVLRSLMNDSRVTEVVNACDAGRAGELIFRLVYDHVCCDKPVKRLWLSSMEEKAIIAAFGNLKDGAEYENLYQSALCRAKADWVVGINASRVFSKLYNRTISVGRVQTPTLAMLYEREKSITDFKKEKYFNVHLKADGLDAVLEKVFDPNEADRIKNACGGQTAVVKSVRNERKTVNPPKLYDLTTLQREANRVYGFTAQQTLDYTQSLYEMRLCTYPRTDSQYLTEDMEDTAIGTAAVVIRKLGFLRDITLMGDVSRVLNSKKVSDHTAIIPTAEFYNSSLDEIPDGEKKILFLIASRLVSALSATYIYDTVTSEIECNGYSYIVRGRAVIDEGFKAVERRFRDYYKVKDDNDEEEAPVTTLVEGQTLTGISTETTEHYTQPPKHFTEDTLLSAMERAGTDELTEEVERSRLRTPATRAGIIEKLTKSGFVKRDKKNLIVSDGGADIISLMPDIVKSASIKATVDESKVTAFKGEVIGTCPRCGRNVLKTAKAYSCENKTCGFAIWKQNKFFENARKELTDDMVKKMLSKGKVAVSGLYSQKSGKTYDADISLDDTGKYVNFKLGFIAKSDTRGDTINNIFDILASPGLDADYKLIAESAVEKLDGMTDEDFAEVGFDDEFWDA